LGSESSESSPEAGSLFFRPLVLAAAHTHMRICTQSLMHSGRMIEFHQGLEILQLLIVVGWLLLIWSYIGYKQISLCPGGTCNESAVILQCSLVAWLESDLDVA